jgi:hypothetical protein
MIMRTVCESTQCTDVKVREKAFECIAHISDLYYDMLQPYVDTLFQLTTTAIRTDDPLGELSVILTPTSIMIIFFLTTSTLPVTLPTGKIHCVTVPQPKGALDRLVICYVPYLHLEMASLFLFLSSF